jgi:hypothetical protein
MIYVASAFTILLILTLSKKHFYSVNGFSLNFIFFFNIGYAYYFLSPPIFYTLFLSSDLEEAQVVIPFLRDLQVSEIHKFQCFTAIFYVLFIVSYRFFKNTTAKKVSASLTKSANINRTKISLCFILSILTGIFAGWQVRGDFFKGYSLELFDDYKDGVLMGAMERGTFIASVTVIFIVMLMSISNETKDKKLSASLFLKSPSFVIYLVFATLMLSLGGRLYFVSHLISMAVYFSMERKVYIKPFRLITYLTAVVMLAGVYGVLRAWEAFAITKIFINIIQEPFYASISLFSFLRDNRMPDFSIPILLITDFINVIPSFIFPDKLTYLNSPEKLGFDVSMPLGGMHVFVSLVINFGLIGSCFFFLLMGAAIALFEGSASKWIVRIIYSLVCGWMTFSFFRDPAHISIVKNIFQYSIVIPLLIYFLIYKRRRYNVVQFS